MGVERNRRNTTKWLRYEYTCTSAVMLGTHGKRKTDRKEMKVQGCEGKSKRPALFFTRLSRSYWMAFKWKSLLISPLHASHRPPCKPWTECQVVLSHGISSLSKELLGSESEGKKLGSAD